jgi:hypothetical protein
MNQRNHQPGFSTKIARSVALFGIAAAMAATIACSENSAPVVNASQPTTASAQPNVVKATDAKAELVETSVSSVRPQSPLLTYRSRDYGVSFQYPWQYARIGPRAMQGNAGLRPTPDGHEGQFALVRINVPRGFYPDTNYQAGYFTLSLNQDLDQEKCMATLPVSNTAVKTELVNGTEFRWVETESGGDGSAATVRNLVNFSNGTCYEVEMGVKTQNDQGLVREVNPDQVMRRLNAILQTVKIDSSVQTASLEEAEEE